MNPPSHTAVEIDASVFAEWHVNPASASIINIPEAELVADPATTLADVPGGARLRAICNAGNASRGVAATLEQHGHDVRSVRDGLIGWSRVLQHAEIPTPGPITVVQFRREARGCLSYLLASDGGRRSWSIRRRTCSPTWTRPAG